MYEENQELNKTLYFEALINLANKYCWYVKNVSKKSIQKLK